MEQAQLVLFEAYWVALRPGGFPKEAKDFLKHMWEREATNFNQDALVQGVTNSINEKYAADHKAFLKMWPAPLRALVSMSICQPFEIEDLDVHYCLSDLNPKKPVVLFGQIDVGVVLSRLIGLGGDDVARGRFQVVALANRLWRARPDLIRHQRSIPEDVASHFAGAGTLYLTAIVVRYSSVLTSVGMWWWLLHGAIHVLNHGLPIEDMFVAAVWAVITVLFFGVATMISKYKSVMQPRMPMLTSKLHRKCSMKDFLYEPEDFDRFLLRSLI